MSSTQSSEFSAIKFNTGLMPESNNSGTFANNSTDAEGFFISPSDVLGRTDITGYILTSANDQGKVEWNDSGFFFNSKNAKETVRAASTADVVEPVTVIDGITLDDGDRILLKDQTDTTENGIYTVSGGLITRSEDAALGVSSTGAYTIAREGTTNGETLWISTEEDSVFGDAITFSPLRTQASGLLPAPLQSIADLTTIGNEMLYTITTDTYATSPISTLGRSFVSLSTTADQRQQLGLEIGVDVQAFSPVLSDLITIAGVNDRIAYTVGGSYSSSTLTPFARTDILTAPDAASLATTLGYILGPVSTVDAIVRVSAANTVAETGISIDNSDNVTGMNDLTLTGNILTTGLINGVNATEFAQLANINATTISTTQWGYLGALDQSLTTTSTPTFFGLSASSQHITNVLDPTNAQDAATKIYVDTVAATGASPLVQANYGTAAVLPNAPVYASPAETITSTGGPGTLAIDGQTVSVADRILVKDQADNRENGVYSVTDDGASPGPNWVLTRSSDFNQAAMPQIAGTSIFIEIVSGASNSGSTYSLQNTVTTVDPLTDAVVWIQIGGIPGFTAGQGIDAAALTGGTIQIENTARFTYSGNALELATVTVPFGGTGQTTLTSNGVLVGQGAAAVDTSKAAPTGDFVGTTDTQTLTNKTVTDSTNNVTSRALFSNSGTNTVSTFASANPTSGQVLTATGATTATWQDATGGITTFERTLTVAQSNPDVSPNWTTLGAALTDAATLTPTASNHVLILIYPGTYSESTPLTVPDFVTISGQASTQGAAIIRPAAPAAVGAVLEVEGNTRLYGIVVDGNDGAGGNATIGVNVTAGALGAIDTMEECTFQNCTTAGVNIIGQGTQFSRVLIMTNCSVLVTQASITMADGILCTLGAILSGKQLTLSGFLSGGGLMTNAMRCINDFSYMDLAVIYISSVVNGIIVGTGVTSNSSFDYPIIRVLDMIIGFYSGTAATTSLKSQLTNYNLIIEDNLGLFPAQEGFANVNPSAPADPNVLIFEGVAANNNTVDFAQGDPTNPPFAYGEIQDLTPGLQQRVFASEVGIGNFALGFDFNASRGTNHFNGLITVQDDGGIPSFLNAFTGTVVVNPLQCDLASTGSIDLTSAPATIDGVAPTSGVSRVLVKDGSTANPGTSSVDNGIYVWNGTGNPMTRSSDFAAAAIIPYTTYFSINLGTVNYGSRWQIDASTFAGNRITVGTTVWGVKALSTPAFPLAPANDDAFYIGSAAFQNFPGVEIRFTAPLTTVAGDATDVLVWEFFNGATWVEQKLMARLSETPYTSFATETMGFGTAFSPYETIGYEYRFGDTTGWVPTTVAFVTGFWVRCRVTDAANISQVPVIELVRLHTDRTTIKESGFVTYFGTGRSRNKKTFMSTNGNVADPAAPANENLVAADDGTTVISQLFVDCQFNNNTIAGRGWCFMLPPEIDTSFPILAIIHFSQQAVGAGDVALRVDFTQTTTGSLLGTNGTPSTDVFTSGLVAVTVGGAAGEQTSGTLELDISSFIVEGSLFWFQIVRIGSDAADTYGSNIFIPVVELEYVQWSNGKYFNA